LGVKKGGMRNTGYDRRYVQRVASKGGEMWPGLRGDKPELS
jgi:hypothetical protein